MNILFVASDNYRYSGAFLSMVKLTSLLQEKYHHHIVVVLPEPEKNWESMAGQKLLDACHVKSVVIPSYTWTINCNEGHLPDLKGIVKFILGWGIAQLSSVPQICKLIKEEDIDLVHINTSWTYIGALAARRMGKPFVWHIREFLEEDQERRIACRKTGYSLMRKADKVIAISDSIYKKYAPILGHDIVTTIMNGIDPDPYYDPEHEILKDEIVEIVIVGSILKNKGQHIAIDACIRLLQRGVKNFRLKIVGRGADEYVQQLRDKVKAGNAEAYITFCGSTDSTWEYYHRADIALVCSKAEAFGRITVEAMLGGALLIGADCAGTSDLVQDQVTGYLYESEDAESLAQKMEYAIMHKAEAREIAENGRAYMRKNMTAELNAERVNALYKDLYNG